MIVWINGTFGSGKTTTARHLREIAPHVREWDPEQVGYMLRTVVGDQQVRNFQDWAAWRAVVVATGDAVSRQTGQHLVAPQTVLVEAYMQEILDGFAACSVKVFHVLLDADAEVLRQRISADRQERGALDWRLEHLVDYEAARPWMTSSADLVIDTSAKSPRACAESILAAAGLG